MPTHTPRQQPVAAVMAFLLDQAEATARAIEGNACEDGEPLDDAVACAWIKQLDMISGVLRRASKAQRRTYLPSPITISHHHLPSPSPITIAELP